LALIYPRPHYLEVVGIILVVTVAVIARGERRGEHAEWSRRLAKVAAIGLVLVLITPSP
jgi:hypothetical protein